MEDHGILNWRKCSIVRKTQIIAAAIGFLLTIMIYQLIRTFSNGESMLGFLLIIPGDMVFFPAARFADLCGWTWKVAGVYQATPPMVLAMIAFNTLVLTIVGTFLGLLLKFTNRSNH